jgi:hypothetical protein
MQYGTRHSRESGVQGPSLDPIRQDPTRVARPVLPPPVPPVASSPHPTAAMPHPPSGHPYRVSKRGRNIYARHPDILDAIPAPIARLPDKAGRRWGGHHLDHGSGRGNADDDTNAGEAGNGGQRQSRGAKKGKDRSCAHGRFLGSCPSFCRVITTYRWEWLAALIAVKKFRFFAPRRSRQSMRFSPKERPLFNARPARA